MHNSIISVVGYTIGRKCDNQNLSRLFTIDCYKYMSQQFTVKFVSRTQFGHSIFGIDTPIDNVDAMHDSKLIVMSRKEVAVFSVSEGKSTKLSNHVIVPDCVRQCKVDQCTKHIFGIKDDGGLMMVCWDSFKFEEMQKDNDEKEIMKSRSELRNIKNVNQKNKVFCKLSDTFESWFINNEKEYCSFKKETKLENSKSIDGNFTINSDSQET